MLPRIKIFFENGALNRVVPSPDGLIGILGSGTAVAGTFALSTAYQLRDLASLAALGVTEANNAPLHKIVKEFYDQAGDGTEVWIMAVPDTVKLSEMVDKDLNYATKLMAAAGGKLRGVVVSRTPASGYSKTVQDGLDGDVYAAVAKAQALAVHSADVLFTPIFVIVEGYGYTGTPADLADLHALTNNRVGVFIGSTTGAGDNQAMGVIAGRIASTPVQRNLGRVKDGPLAPVKTYVGSTPTELANVAAAYDKGFITFRTYIGRSGYFFVDDPLATAGTDDYSNLTARRTIDKAFRIAYDTLLDQLLDEVPVNANGTMQAPMVKTWQQVVENAIATQMTAQGELSADATDPKDRGVICYIDPNQNIVSTGKMNVSIRVRPFGYPRYIDVYLGFEVVS